MTTTTTTNYAHDLAADWDMPPREGTLTGKGTSRAGAPCTVCDKVHDRGNNVDRAARKVNMARRDGTVCTWCDTVLAPTRCEADRIVAGGRYTLANVVTACRGCNDGRKDGSWRDAVATAKTPARALAVILRATGNRQPSAHLR